jgi:hypothetical protein
MITKPAEKISISSRVAIDLHATKLFQGDLSRNVQGTVTGKVVQGTRQGNDR